jgi:hypothetical protein
MGYGLLRSLHGHIPPQDQFQFKSFFIFPILSSVHSRSLSPSFSRAPGCLLFYLFSDFLTNVRQAALPSLRPAQLWLESASNRTSDALDEAVKASEEALATVADSAPAVAVTAEAAAKATAGSVWTAAKATSGWFQRKGKDILEPIGLDG